MAAQCASGHRSVTPFLEAAIVTTNQRLVTLEYDG